MKHETFAPPSYREGLEADAVCQQCGSVNPEGTLICKTCGNNLRDQRLLRMQADQILDADVTNSERSVFLMRALPVLGILLILWLGLNVGRMTDMLTSADNATSEDIGIVADPGVFWSGPASATYDAMFSDLTANLPSEADAENAKINVFPSSTLQAGNYVLFERLGTGSQYTGVAAIEVDGDTCRYNASLNGGIEIRGEASLLEGIFVSEWEQAGALYQGQYLAISGTAEALPNGSIDLSGESSHNTQVFRAVAYPYNAR